MTSSMNRNTIRVPCGDNVPTTQKVDDLFVSIDLTGDVACAVHDCSSTLLWREISRADAELLVAMEAHAQVAMRVPRATSDIQRRGRRPGSRDLRLTAGADNPEFQKKSSITSHRPMSSPLAHCSTE